MFDLPASRAVRRSELDSPNTSRSSSPTATNQTATKAKLAAYFADLYGDITPAPVSTEVAKSHVDINIDGSDAAEPEVEDRDGAVAFRLFSNSTDASASTEHARILIRSPTPENRESGLVVPRDKSYYLAAPWIDSLRAAAAPLMCTPESVAAEAGKSWPGCRLPWRVRTIKVTKQQAAALTTSGSGSDANIIEAEVDGDRPARRCKPGKKKRMMIRAKRRAKVEAEEAEREKKTRRNREKKVKKREKEKAKKAGEGQMAPTDGAAADANSP